MDSNHRLQESKSCALPLGKTPIKPQEPWLPAVMCVECVKLLLSEQERCQGKYHTPYLRV